METRSKKNPAKLPARGPLSMKVVREGHIHRARTLVRVISVEKHWLKVCLPGWNHRSFFKVPRSIFPKFPFERGYRFYANINLAALRPQDLAWLPPFEEGSAKVPSWEELGVKRGAMLLKRSR